MILKKEIEKIALQENVSRSMVDKDWVLGHFIDAIFSIPLCRDSLVFKGGTCLKKCYIPDYRLIQCSYPAPRDYFDILYLSKKLTEIEWPIIVNAFHEKMKFKNLEFIGIDQFLNDDVDKKLTGAWKNSLAHQIPNEQLPPYSVVKEELLVLFRKIFNTN